MVSRVIGTWPRGASFKTPPSWWSALPIPQASKERRGMLGLGDLGSSHSFVTTVAAQEIFNHLNVSFCFSKMWIHAVSLQGSCEVRIRCTCESTWETGTNVISFSLLLWKEKVNCLSPEEWLILMTVFQFVYVVNWYVDMIVQNCLPLAMPEPVTINHWSPVHSLTLSLLLDPFSHSGLEEFKADPCGQRHDIPSLPCPWPLYEVHSQIISTKMLLWRLLGEEKAFL